MSRPHDELLYSLIISQLKDDGFLEEAESLQRKVVNAVFNIEASRQLRKIVEIMSVTSGMSWRKLTTNAQCPQGVILNLKPGNDSLETSREDHAPLDKFTGLTEDQMHDNRTEQRGSTPGGIHTSEQRIGELREIRTPASAIEPQTAQPPPAHPPQSHSQTHLDHAADHEEDEQKWKKEMEHMRFDFKLSRKVDFKIHNYDPSKKRGGTLDEKHAKRMKGSSAQGKFFHIKMTKDAILPEEKRGPILNKGSMSAPSLHPPPVPRDKSEEQGDGQKANLQDFLQKITIPMDKLN